jgi:hypothetical protein
MVRGLIAPGELKPFVPAARAALAAQVLFTLHSLARLGSTRNWDYGPRLTRSSRRDRL